MSNEDRPNILKPVVDPSVFVAEGARIFGDVEIGAGSSVWFNAVIRGDKGKIVIGKDVNIQDNAVVHSGADTEAVIGDEVTIGNCAVVRSCRIGRGSLIGMNATVMTYAEIGEYSIVGANALVPYRATFPPRSLILGMPAKRIRDLTDEEIEGNENAVRIYRERVKQYKAQTVTGFSGRPIEKA